MLTDAQWAKMEQLRLGKVTDCIYSGTHTRLVIEGI